MRRSHGSPCFVDNIDVFMCNWKFFTHDSLSTINWSNIIAAGGSILGCLNPDLNSDMSHFDIGDFYRASAYNESDIDLFIYGLSPEEAKMKMLQVAEQIQSAFGTESICVRKPNTISIHTTWPNRPIQVVLRLYKSPAEVVAGFDVDAACCLFNGEKVYISPRCLAASIRQCNTIDLSRRSPSYEVRLGKYADRGFEVYYPELDRKRVNTGSLYNPERQSYPNGLARLIVVELIRVFPSYYKKLYRPRRRYGAPPPNPPSTVDFRPVEELLSSNYDYSYVHIPYKPDWDARTIERLIKRIDRKKNSSFNPANEGRRLHRHAATAGTIIDCIYGSVCANCPAPINPEEEQLVRDEAMLYIRGRLRYIETDPGRQIVTGSFQPITLTDWSEEAYIHDHSDGEIIHDTNLTLVDNEDRSLPLDTSPASLDQALVHASCLLERNSEQYEKDILGEMCLFLRALLAMSPLTERAAEASSNDQ